jgi:SAM-dependent methyltransferase
VRDLDLEATEYTADAATSFENNLILKWYPERVVKITGHIGSLLELGVGHGYTAELFNKYCDRHVIVDGAPSVIESFTNAHPQLDIEIFESYFEEFNINEKFDVVVMGFVLEHVDDPVAVLDRFRKYLKKGGKLFVAVPNGESLNRRLGYEMGLIDSLTDLNKNDLSLGHKRNYSLKGLVDDIESAGYKVVNKEGIYLKPLPLPVLQSLENADANFDAMLKVGIDFPELSVGMLVEAVIA